MNPLTDDEIHATVKDAIQQGVDYVEADIAEERIKATRYFEGECDVPYDEDRSKVIATKCRDAVRRVKPSLLRLFFQSGKPVEFLPSEPQDVAAAEQATAYINWKFRQCDGYRVLSDAIQDALVKKVGFVKVYYDETEDDDVEDVSGVLPQEFAVLAADVDEVLEYDEHEDGTVSGKLRRVKTSGKLRLESMPPEEFFVNAEARGPDDFYCIGHRTELRVSDLVEMGFDFDEVKELSSAESTVQEEEEYHRNDYTQQDEDESPNDPSMRKVMVTECYMKMDTEGTGIAKLHKFICGGNDYKVLSQEEADEVPFAVFEVDPEPHTFFGRSLVDILIEDQDQATSMLRGLLDNVHLSNNPGLAVNDTNDAVNMDDVLNNEIGRIVRCAGDPAGKILPLEVPFTAGATLPALQYFDEVCENKTGVTQASAGLDPDTLQNASATAVNATVQGGQAQSEVMARNLAEGGMRRLFRLMLRLLHKHPGEARAMQIGGEFVPVDASMWNPEMDVTVNIGLGTGGTQDKLLALQATYERQKEIWMTYGPTNGLVTLTNMRNTLADINELAGVHNNERYFQPMNMEREMALLQQAQAAQQGQQMPDPNQGIIAAEQIKAQAKTQTDMARLQLDAQKAMAEEQRKRRELMMDDDRERDAMVQDLAIKVAEILGKHGTQVDVARVQAEQQRDR